MNFEYLYINFFSHISAVNLAVGKDAQQSSTATGGEAKQAVDGDTKTDFLQGSCIQTAGGKYIINIIILFILIDLLLLLLFIPVYPVEVTYGP